MKNLLIQNRSFVLVTIIFFAALPLSFQLSDIGGDTTLSFVFLEEFPTVGLLMGLSVCLLAFLTFKIFNKAQQWGVIALFACAPLTSFSIGDLPATWIAWDYLPLIGALYWSMALIFLKMRGNYSVEVGR